MSRQRRLRCPAVRGVLGCFVLLACALPVSALAGPDDESPHALQGTWRVVGFPGTPNQFYATMAFNEGGTLTAIVDSGSGISTAIGVWRRIRPGEFAATFENFFDSNANGSYDLRFRVRMTIRLSDHDTWTASATLEVVSRDGTTVVGGPVSIPHEGTRMRVVRE